MELSLPVPTLESAFRRFAQVKARIGLPPWEQDGFAVVPACLDEALRDTG
jgi:hypothetical protein